MTKAEETEQMKKRVERYKTLLATKKKAGAGPERIRLFRKKLKRFQRRIRKLAGPKPKEKTGEAKAPGKPQEKEEAKKA